MPDYRTPTPVIISALRILARDIESGDGVANATIAEAADRLEELDDSAEYAACKGLRDAYALCCRKWTEARNGER